MTHQVTLCYDIGCSTKALAAARKSHVFGWYPCHLMMMVRMMPLPFCLIFGNISQCLQLPLRANASFAQTYHALMGAANRPHTPVVCLDCFCRLPPEGHMCPQQHDKFVETNIGKNRQPARLGATCRGELTSW
jgi:hypothetical protein